MTTPTAPGDLVTLRAGSSTAVIAVDVGGRLAQLDLGGGPLLRPWAPGLGWAHWGCYPLVPWPNRIPGGHLRFGELDVTLPVTWPDGSAIHGLAADRAWTVRDRTDASVALEIEMATPPYDLLGRLEYRLAAGSLAMELSVTNLGSGTVPVGLGIHPWFRAGAIRVPAAEVWPGEPVPSGPPVAVTGSDDLRRSGPPGLMDRCYTGLTGSSADAPGVQLRWDGPIGHVVVYTGEPGWVCIEPVTMATDGFGIADRGGDRHGIHALEPTGTFTVSYEFHPTG